MMKCSFAMRNSILVFVLAVLFPSMAIANSVTFRVPPTNEDEFFELFKASSSYLSAALVCGNKKTVGKAKNTYLRVKNYGKYKGIVHPLVRAILSFEKEHFELWMSKYREQKWVTCGQVSKEVKKLDAMTIGME